MALARSVALAIGETVFVISICCLVGGTPGLRVPDGHMWAAILLLHRGLTPFLKGPASAAQLLTSATETGVIILAAPIGLVIVLTAHTLQGEMWQHKLHHGFLVFAIWWYAVSSAGEAAGFLFAGASCAMLCIVLLCIAAVLMNHPGKYEVESLGHRMVACLMIAAAAGAAGVSTGQFAGQGRVAVAYFVSLAGVVMASISTFLRYTRSDDGVMDTMMMYMQVGSGALALTTCFIVRLSSYYGKRPKIEKELADPSELARVNKDFGAK